MIPPCAIRHKGKGIARTVAGRRAQQQLALADVLRGPGGAFEGVQLRKLSVPRGDEKVRTLHRRLHGDNRALEDAFWRWPGTGEKLAYPGCGY